MTDSFITSKNHNTNHVLESRKKDSQISHPKIASGFLRFDKEGKIFEATPEFLSLTKLTHKEIIGRNLKDFIGDVTFEKCFLYHLSDLLNQKIPHLNFEALWRVTNKEPLLFNFEFLMSSCYGETFKGWIHKTYPTIESPIYKSNFPSQIYLEQIAQNIKTVMWVSSLNASKVYYISPNFEDLYDITIEEYVKNPQEFVKRIHPADRAKFEKIFSFPDSLSIKELGFWYLRNTGDWQHVTVYRTPLSNEAGVLVKIAGIAINDTNVYKSQLQLEQQQNVLKLKNEELKKKNQMLEDFTAFACHDLTQPLRVFKTYTQLLEKHYLQEIDLDGKRILDSMYKGVDRMKGLIEAMVNLLLIKEDLQNVSWIDVSALLNTQVEPFFLPSFMKGGIIERKNLEPLWAAPDHLKILFKNLIENGIKYNNKTPYIKIHSKRFKTGIVYTIKDNGIGIPASTYQEILKIGRRLHDKPETSGNGIGLSACEKIMSFYNGKIWLHSKINVGSIFYLFFPFLKDNNDSEQEIIPSFEKVAF